VSSEKPEGWFYPLPPITPPRLAGGERVPVIISAMAAASAAFFCLTRVHGTWAFILAGAVVVGWMVVLGLLVAAWRRDPWLLTGGTLSGGGTFFRFSRWPRRLRSHSSWATNTQCAKRTLRTRWPK
jgi:hypothetical protein